MTVAALEETLFRNWPPPAPAGTLQTLEADKSSVIPKGNSLLAPKLHINEIRFKPIPFDFKSHIPVVFLYLCMALMRAVQPHKTPGAPISPLRHLPPDQTLIWDSSSTVC